jgi:hypothetical protein
MGGKSSSRRPLARGRFSGQHKKRAAVLTYRLTYAMRGEPACRRFSGTFLAMLA